MRERAFIEPTLPAADGAWTQGRAVGFLRRAGTRTAVYTALGMLLRDGPGDHVNAATIVREVLRTQRTRPGAHEHGLWPRSPRRPVYDLNWREFVSLGLIAIRASFAAALGADLIARTDEALVRAAEGSARRQVPLAWTNVALMKALLLDCAALRSGRQEFAEQAATLARGIDGKFQRHGTFCEFNSPTYAGVDALALAIWRQFAPSATLRTIGARLESSLWNDVAAFYHPALGNLCGPFGRAYGLDMHSYPALVGLPMAMSGVARARTPWPAPSPRTLEEQAYASLFAAAPPSIPAQAKRMFADLDAPRRLRRTVACDDSAYEVAAVLEPTWMMGAAAGMPSHGDQHRPATIHWLADEGVDEGSVGWLTVESDGAIDARIRGESLEIAARPSSPPAAELRAWIKAPDVEPAALAARKWPLPGMDIEVGGSLGAPSMRIAEAPRLGSVLEATWTLPEGESWTLALAPRRRRLTSTGP